ncbi:MAG: ABC transporter permease subunit [Chloroflexi bacterium]|nr:ABC transporter permease subunit [Chloroflexota bacterium]
MPFVVFRETLRRSWRGMLMWGGGFALIALVQAVVLGDVDALREFADLVASMPPFLLQFLGTDDVNVLATPEGYLAGRFFSFVVVMFAVYAVLSGLNITAADEDRGILNSVLSTPLPRWQLIAGKFAAYAVLLLGVTLITFAGAAGGVLSTPVAATFPMGRLFEMTIALFPIGLVALAFTALLAALLPSRSRVMTIAFGAVIGSFFLNFLAASVGDDLLSTINRISVFSYYRATDIVKNGMATGALLVLIVVAVVLVGVSMVAFQRRDIAA